MIPVAVLSSIVAPQALGVLRALTVPGDVPATPDAEEARQAAERELERPQYHEQPSLLSRIWSWLIEHLDPRTAVPLVPSWVSALIVVLLLALLIAVVVTLLTRVRGVRRATMPPDALFTDSRSASALHRAADDAAAHHDWATAIIERFRAIIRSLDERGLLVDYPGLTAREASRASAAALPGLDNDLMHAGRLFDEVRYGEVMATVAQEQWMTALAAQVRAARAPASPTTKVGAPT